MPTLAAEVDEMTQLDRGAATCFGTRRTPSARWPTTWTSRSSRPSIGCGPAARRTAGSASPASASRPTSARSSPARSTRPAPAPTCSTPPGPSTATSGMVHADDVVLVLSHSGESEEIVRLLEPLRRLAAAVVAITGNAASTLRPAGRRGHRLPGRSTRPARSAWPRAPARRRCSPSATPWRSPVRPARSSPPRTSPATTRPAAWAASWPRSRTSCAAAPSCGSPRPTDTVRDVFARARHSGRRTGAVMLVDADGRLAGLFTDSDLARLFERRRDDALRPADRAR